jgi:NAD(P)-dependent dehydrogenase (short-subunit alcohol dehydrogenase family)
MRIMITGASDGIGLATAQELARRGHSLVIHGRPGAKLDRALETVRNSARPSARSADRTASAAATGTSAPRSAGEGGTVEAVPADLASLREVSDLAEDVARRAPDLQVLLLNAGVMSRERALSRDGYELTLAVNHLAPMLLTEKLLPVLTANAPARVVVVSSMVHSGGSIDFDDLQCAERYDGMRAYSASKLANVYMTRVLAESHDPEKITANALHPGVISTKLLHEYFGGGADTASGAATSVYLAESPEVAGVSGAYFSNRQRQESPAMTAAEHRETAQRLWNESRALIDRALHGVENG